MASFVLVPGAWLGGWCWCDVAGLLRRAGHDAVTITLTGLAERVHLLTPAVGLDTHIEDVVGTLVYKDLHDVFLVGHSYGGTVTTVAAARVPERLRGLVYLDASIPTNGQSNNDVLPPRIGKMVRERARECGDGWQVPPPPAIDWGLDDATRAWVVPKLTPHLFQRGKWTSVRIEGYSRRQVEKLIRAFGLDPKAIDSTKSRPTRRPAKESEKTKESKETKKRKGRS